MLRLWGRANSINVQKVLWTLAELGRPFERIDAGGLFGRVNDPEFLRLNPNRKVPVVEDDGFVLWESNAIVRYLCASDPEGLLMPESLRSRAWADQWMDWQATELWPAMRPLFWQLVRTPDSEQDPAVIEAGTRDVAELFRHLDGWLAEHSYVAGTTFSMGDIPLGVTAYRWHALGVERPPVPALKAWYERLCDRPDFQRWVMQPLT